MEIDLLPWKLVELASMKNISMEAYLLPRKLPLPWTLVEASMEVDLQSSPL